MWPNLAFSFGIVIKFMERLKVSHMAAVKRILRYVKGFVGYGILFPAADTAKNTIYSILLILTGTEIKMIKSLQLDTYLCSV